MAIVTRLGKGSKLTIEEMDNNLLSLESGVSDNVSSITNKLDKGSYTGTAQDLKALIDTKGIVGPTGATGSTGAASTVAGPTGATGSTGAASTIPGPTGATGSGVKITTWSAGAYALGNQVNHLGKDWTANAATVAGDIPGTSTKWDVRLFAYENKVSLNPAKNLFDKTKVINAAYLTTSDGTNNTSSASNYFISDYIRVLSSTSYIRSGNTSSFYSFYDTNKVFISGGTDSGVRTTPANAVFIRFSDLLTKIDTTQFELGSVATSFAAFELVIQESFIPASIARKTDILSELEISQLVKLSPNKNLFDKTKVLTGFSLNQTTGVTSVTNNYFVSDYIKVTPNSSYISSGNTSNRYAWYDLNKVFISGFDASGVRTAPTNAIFIRFSDLLTKIDTTQFELGSVATSFAAFELVIQEGLISASIARKTDIPVPVDTTSFAKLVVGKNLFDKAKVLNGLSLNHTTGLTSGNASYFVSEYISIVGGATYVISGNTSGRHSWYDLNKVFISGADTQGSRTAPTNAVFIRFQDLLTKIDTTQFELGSVATSFAAFELVIQESLIPASIARKSDLPNTSNFATLAIGKNLFNASNTITGGALNYITGESASSAQYYLSEYIQVTPNSSYVASGNTSNRYVWYDLNKVFISGFDAIGVRTAPENAVFIRFQDFLVNKDITQFELSTQPTFYEDSRKEVQETVKNNSIKISSLSKGVVKEIQNKANPICSTDVQMIIGYGQSLSVFGSGSDSSTNFREMLSFSGGINENTNNVDITNPTSVSSFYGTGLVKLSSYVANNYPPSVGTAVTWMRLLELEDEIDLSSFAYQFIASAPGFGGQSIEQLSKGTVYYNRLLFSVQKGMLLSLESGKSFSVPVVTWVQGESNKQDTTEVYYAKMVQLFSDLNTDIKAITKQLKDVQIITYQMITKTGQPSGPTFAQLKIAKEVNNVHLGGAMYQYNYNDSDHASDPANTGMQLGIQAKRVISDNKPLPVFTIKSHIVQNFGSFWLINFEFIVPVEPMRFDISGDAWHNARGKQVNFGFVLNNASGTSVIESEPVIKRGNSMTIKCNADPIGLNLSYALTGQYGGGNLCDSQNIIIYNKGINYVIDNFCPIFKDYII
jgi:hypothetical protein